MEVARGIGNWLGATAYSAGFSADEVRSETLDRPDWIERGRLPRLLTVATVSRK